MGKRLPQVETAVSSKKAKAAPATKKKAEDPAPAKKKARRPDHRRSRGPRGPMEPMRHDRVKDSTEQKSLMKPYYLDN